MKSSSHDYIKWTHNVEAIRPYISYPKVMNGFQWNLITEHYTKSWTYISFTSVSKLYPCLSNGSSYKKFLHNKNCYISHTTTITLSSVNAYWDMSRILRNRNLPLFQRFYQTAYSFWLTFLESFQNSSSRRVLSSFFCLFYKYCYMWHL
jgi:hypothetical protein